MLNQELMQVWLDAANVGARVQLGECIQSLWSGYGELRRVKIEGAPVEHAVLKWVDPSHPTSHPRGWQGNAGHVRKLRSYEVETAFYRGLNPVSDSGWRVPACLAAEVGQGGQVRLLLEDLDAAGYAARAAPGEYSSLCACLQWLAEFHAAHLNQPTADLWPVGCYWHLDTRVDEWQAMASGPLKDAAEEIDKALNNARYKTWVHGDAKLANFCLQPAPGQAAAVDFQYVGGGVGVRDLVPLFSSALSSAALQRDTPGLLERYFTALRANLTIQIDGPELEAEWRALWPVAWADYIRFLDGWMPGHARRTAFAQARVQEALSHLM